MINIYSDITHQFKVGTVTHNTYIYLYLYIYTNIYNYFDLNKY